MLAVSFDTATDRLTVCQFGALPERRLPECRLPISEHLRFFMRRPQGTVIGFEVRGLHVVDVDGELPSLWSGPRFRVPTLGLMSASVAEIVLRARVVLAGRSTPDVLALARADGLLAAGELADADAALREALAAGSLRAHITCRAAWPRARRLRPRSGVHRARSTRFARLGAPGTDLCRARRQHRGHGSAAARRAPRAQRQL